jgi:hypothetical protein
MPNWEIVYFSRVKNEKEKEKKGHRRMNRRYLDSKRRCNGWTSWYTWWKPSTIGWTNGPFSSSVGRVAEKNKRRQWHRMNRRSIGRNHRSIRWSSSNKTETHQDSCSSTGWTDGSAAVHPTVAWKLPERFWPWGLQHQMIQRCVGA